jgi:hypothetical protein
MPKPRSIGTPMQEAERSVDELLAAEGPMETEESEEYAHMLLRDLRVRRVLSRFDRDGRWLVMDECDYRVELHTLEYQELMSGKAPVTGCVQTAFDRAHQNVKAAIFVRAAVHQAVRTWGDP